MELGCWNKIAVAVENPKNITSSDFQVIYDNYFCFYFGPVHNLKIHIFISSSESHHKAHPDHGFSRKTQSLLCKVGGGGSK